MSDLSLISLEVAVFDWDNTLAMSRGALVCSVNKVLAEFGLDDWDKVQHLRDRNLSFRDNFPRIFGSRSEQAYARYREVYRENVASLIKAPEMAVEVLRYLQNKGIENIIVSNKDRLLLDFELPLLYDRTLFSRIVCGHEAKRDKPYPEQLWYGVDGLVSKVSTDNVWMIGDSPMDSNCALSAGAKAIRIGQPIWGCDDVCEKQKEILFFADFVDFYRAITE